MLRAPVADRAAGTDVVLEATRRGREEIERRRFPLREHQRRLLGQLDGHRSLADCADADPRLQPVRLLRDAARLVAFGLARQVHGELPPQLMVEAMDLTARIPLDQLPPLEPERTVSPTMSPRVAPSPSRHAPAHEEPPPQAEGLHWSVALLAVMLAAAIGAIRYFS
jgi:hypothetical protein